MGLQVELLTQNKSCYEKEFIDFEFNGKHISEFGMVAVSDGDRHSFAASPNFEDEITEVNGAAGQLFWGTKIKSRKMSFKLATDGMTERQVNAFKFHFKPGQYGKFIEDKFANRYGYCRVAEVVNFSMVPFQKSITIMGYPTFINEYKGEATIVFEFDDPYLYSTINYIEEATNITEKYRMEILKAIYNNGVPLHSSWADTLFIDPRGSHLGKAILRLMILGLHENIGVKLCHLGKDKCLQFDGTVSSLIEDTGHNEVGVENPMIYYNPSNVKTPAKITIQFVPSFNSINYDNWEPIYFNNISDDININSLKGQARIEAVPYNSILGSKILIAKEGINHATGESVMKIPAPLEDDFVYQFHYTSPNVIYSINRTIQIAYDFYNNNGAAAVDLEKKIREEITHEKVLKWALSCFALIRQKEQYCDINDQLLSNTITVNISFLKEEQTTYEANWFAYFNIMMLLFLCENSGYTGLSEKIVDIDVAANDTWVDFYPYTVIFDGKKSQSIIQFNYNNIVNLNEIKNYSGEEFCGDMILTPYFNLEGGDYVEDNGQIASCHSLEFVQNAIIKTMPHIKLEYDYTYL